MAMDLGTLRESLRQRGGIYQWWKSNVDINVLAGGAADRQPRAEAIKELFNIVRLSLEIINADTAAQAVHVGQETMKAIDKGGDGAFAQADAMLMAAKVQARHLFKDDPKTLAQALKDLDPQKIQGRDRQYKLVEPNTLPDTMVVSMQMQILGTLLRTWGAMNVGQPRREDFEDRLREMFDSIENNIGAHSPSAGRFQTRRAFAHIDMLKDIAALTWVDRVQVDPSYTLRQGGKAVMHEFFTHSTGEMDPRKAYDSWENMVHGIENKRNALYAKYKDTVLQTLEKAYGNKIAFQPQHQRDELYKDEMAEDARLKNPLFKNTRVLQIRQGRSWETISKLYGAAEYIDPDLRNWGEINRHLREDMGYGDKQIPLSAVVSVVAHHGQHRQLPGGRHKALPPGKKTITVMGEEVEEEQVVPTPRGGATMVPGMGLMLEEPDSLPAPAPQQPGAARRPATAEVPDPVVDPAYVPARLRTKQQDLSKYARSSEFDNWQNEADRRDGDKPKGRR